MDIWKGRQTECLLVSESEYKNQNSSIRTNVVKSAIDMSHENSL